MSTNALLSISASPRRDKSISSALGERFIRHWSDSRPQARVIRRNLYEPAIPYMDTPWILGAYLPPEVERTPDMQAALGLSTALIDELKAVDHLLITTPMYNFTVPAVLKSWIDYIVRPGLTFQPGPDGSRPLLHGKSATVIVASRGDYRPGTPDERIDFVTPVLRQALGYIGIEAIRFIPAGGSFGVNRGLVRFEDHVASFDSVIAAAAADTPIP